MQPFLFRSTRTTTTLSSNFCNSIYAATREQPFPIDSTADTPGLRSKSGVYQKFGDFYRRFYSAVSGSLAEKPHASSVNRRTYKGQSMTKILAGIHGPRRGRHRPWPVRSPISARLTSRPSRTLKFQPWVPAKRPPPGPRSLSDKEEATNRLVRQLNDHDHVARYLEKEIREKQRLMWGAKTIEERDSCLEDLRVLRKIYTKIEARYYDVSAPGTILAAALDNEHDRRRIPIIPPPTYVLPYPNYTSDSPPHSLNNYLHALFRSRPPPDGLLHIISHRLLTSPSAPDIKTYNILIHGFSILRQNSLAHMVFRSLIDEGLKPDAFSMVAILNLSTKSADIKTFSRVIRIYHNPPETPDTGLGHHGAPPRSKNILEAMIFGAAKFGQVKRVTAYLSNMRRDFPDSKPSIHCLTSVLQLWTRRRNWGEGSRVWNEIKSLEKDMATPESETKGTQGTAPVNLDQRAFHQMVRLCDACGKSKEMISVVREAKRRGWSEWEILIAPNKTKGLHLKSEFKIPRLIDILPHYSSLARYAPSRREVQRQRRIRERVLKSVENAFGSALKAQDSERMRDKLYDAVFAKEGIEKQQPQTPSLSPVSDDERYEIWAHILAQRIEQLRNEPPSDATAASEEKPDEAWKPNIKAYQRGAQ